MQKSHGIAEKELIISKLKILNESKYQRKKNGSKQTSQTSTKPAARLAETIQDNSLTPNKERQGLFIPASGGTLVKPIRGGQT